MEVSGRRPHKLNSATKENSSDELQICAVCLEEIDKAVEAEGFCVTCNEFLCAHCYNIHRSPRPMRSHKLLDKQRMPDKPFPPEERCPKHNENLLEYFCSSHKQLACSVCIRTVHKRCADVDHILDVCDHDKAATELERTREGLAELEGAAETNSTEIDFKTKTVEQLKASIVSEFKEFQRELIDHIEKSGEDLEKEIQQLTSQDKAKLQQMAEQNDNLKSEIKQVTDELDLNKKYDRKLNLFTSMNMATSRISSLTARLHQIKDNNTFIQYGFVRDPKLQTILEQPKTLLGQITCTNDNDEISTLSAAESNCDETERMTKMKSHENIKTESNESNRSAEVTTERFHNVESTPENQAGGDGQKEATGETGNNYVTETILHGSLRDADRDTSDDQQTDTDTLRRDIKATARDIDHDQAATKSCKTERNVTSETSPTAIVQGKIMLESKLNAKLASDKEGYWITGMTMLPGNRLVVVDRNNKVIKLLDTKAGTILSHISVGGYPWDVTVVSRDRLAVTLSGYPGKIQFVSVSGDRLSAEGYIRVSPGCFGIACHGNMLYVSYISKPAQVQVLDLHGRVLQTFIRDAAGQPLFDYPEYIAVSSDGNMYISDYDKDTLTCLDPQGQVQWRYQDTKLRRPTGVVVDKHGTVYVTGWRSNNIHVVSPAGNQLHVLKDDKIQGPYSLTFSEDGDRLYVGMRSNSNILVYRVKLSSDP